jgi:uncharacterized protein YcaQ
MLSADEARRIALAAQGLEGSGKARERMPAGAAAPGLAAVRRTAEALQAIQIDSVNVLVRAHYLPLYSRLGPYPMAHLDRLTNDRHELIETRFGHQASYVPVALEPHLRWRREWARQKYRAGWRKTVDAAYVAEVEAQVADRGPLSLRDLDDPRRRPVPTDLRRLDGRPYAAASLAWHRPSDGKTVLDGLLAEGRLMLAGRRGADRLYDLAERVLPADVLARATPPADESRRELVARSARALGVATVADLAGYFELKIGDTRQAVADLVTAGELDEVAVEGWSRPAYVVRGARVPRRLDGLALLGVFDSLTWSRERTRRLFGFDFSFEIYVPEAQRRFGYYVLPFLLGDRLVARVDLKADRARSRLVVVGAFAEADAEVVGGAPSDVTAALAAELERMASWLGLDDVEIRGRGPLGLALRRSL